MNWSLTTWILVVSGTILAFAGVQFLYLLVVLLWSDRRTVRLHYFGLPYAERLRFKRVLSRHARVLWPILSVLRCLSSFTFEKASFRYRGIAAPKGTCSRASFERAEAYEPLLEDVFIVTQMKSGTTWMQHLAYQVLLRGNGNLAESDRTLYALSPWLEGRKSVSVEEAPLIGSERPSRVIKTHLPALLCPYSLDARYIYVVRHPVSCFASIVDFVTANTGMFAPDLDTIRAWFCSEDMWWGSWPAHVEGWWRQSQQVDNLLFVRFEDMKGNLNQIARRVSEFLGLPPLTGEELEQIVGKCRFEYMRQYGAAFEMHPPHVLAPDPQLLVRGSAERHADVPEEIGHRIRAWCDAELRSGSYPLHRMYPDLR